MKISDTHTQAEEMSVRINLIGCPSESTNHIGCPSVLIGSEQSDPGTALFAADGTGIFAADKAGIVSSY